MSNTPQSSIAEHFKQVEDPRIDRSKAHLLIDILTIAILSIICGADGWVGMESYGTAKEPWLRRFLELPNGIPSHDTFSRVFTRLDPEQLQTAFLSWVRSVSQITEGEVIAIDGKRVRRSYDEGKNQGAIHMVSAWASQNRLVLGQFKVNDKSNEITAIPALLKVLDLKGCIVTIDAMGTQRAIAQQIVSQEGDYVLALKGNQGGLYEDVQQLFDWAHKQSFKDINHDFYETIEANHGRIEKRRCWSLGGVEGLIDSKQWAKLTSIAMLEAIREVKGETSRAVRFYISSLQPRAKQLAEAVRSHWSGENPLHSVLDVAFNEDDSRIRTGHAPQNLVVLRHLAVSALNQERTVKLGIKNKRLRAGWDNDYLLKVLTG